MKLAKVEHFRCEQPAGKWGLSTYVWIADEMSEADFAEDCERARKAYLDNEEIWKKAAPVHQPDIGIRIAEYPETMTVAEIKAAHEKKKEEYKEYETKRTNARKSFTTLLVEASNGRIKYFWNGPVVFSHDLSWGHNHGTTIDYGETESGDYPPEEEENWL